MEGKTLLIAGGIGLGAILLLSLAKNMQKAQVAQTQLAVNAQYAGTTAGQVGGILSSVGSFFNSGALQSLNQSFLNTGPANQPGLLDSGYASPDVNDPGLLDTSSISADAGYFG